MHNETFLELARTWKYCGLPANIEFSFLPNGMVAFNPYKQEYFENEARKHLYSSIQDAEGYFAMMLEKVEVPGVITYTLSGGKTNG